MQFLKFNFASIYFRYFFGLFLILFSSHLLAQSIPSYPNLVDKEGFKQGKWIILYDQNWNVTDDVSLAKYYRQISYQDGKPIGKVTDYYANGTPQMIIDSLISEESNTCEGQCLFFSKEGNVTDLKYYYKASLNRDTTILLFRKILEKQAQTIPEHLDHAEASNHLAGLYHDQGSYEQAEIFYAKAKTIYEKKLGQNHPKFALICNNLSLLYQDKGAYATAEPLAIQAKSIYQKVFGENHKNYALACNNLALIYWKQGIYEEAEPLYLEAKNIYERLTGKNNFRYAAICNNLAMLYQDQELYTKAEPFYLETKNTLSKLLGENNPQYALICNNIGLFYYSQKLFEKAEPLYLEAKNIWEKTLGQNHPYYVTTLGNLALLYHNQGLYTQAEPLYLEVANTRERLLGQGHLDYAIACNNLGILYFDQKAYELAEPWFKKASQIWIKQTENNFINLSEKEKTQFLNTFNYSFDIYYSFFHQTNNPKLNAWIYNHILTFKGILFWSNQKIRERILNSSDELLKQEFQTWQDKRNYLAKVYNLSNAERRQQGINNEKLKLLEKEANDVEKKLSEKSQLFMKTSTRKQYTWKDVQKQLKPGEVAVEMIRTRFFNKKRTDSVLYIALILKPDNQDYPEFVILPNGQELENKYLTYYHNAIRYQTKDFYSYQQYWQTLSHKLLGAKKVYLSADGVYHQINLNTLLNPSTGKYVLEEVDLQLLGSTRDLITLNEKDVPVPVPGASILLGRPKYDLSIQEHQSLIQDSSRAVRGAEETSFYTVGQEMAAQNWGDLRGAEKEVRKIHEIFLSKGQNSELFLYEQALEEVIKQARNPLVLHIATHGFFLENVEPSPDEASKTDYLELQNSPMMRSGIVLTGINTYAKNKAQYNIAIEDGLLTAYEASNLNLDYTELVVLSACQTGQGRVQNGEGVYGLQRGFQAAGAKSLLMSLWSVSDEATQNLMIAFYENWVGKKLSKREAFRKAQLEMMESYKNPYYWGAFVMVGE